MSRLLLVNAEGAAPSSGGAEAVVSMLARGLGARGWEVEVLAAFPADVPSDVETTTLHATSWRSSNSRRILNHVGDVIAAAPRHVRDAVDAAAPDVVHTHNLPGFSTAVWGTAAAAGARVVHTLHDYYLLCPRVTLHDRDGRPCRRGRFCRYRTKRLRHWSDAVDAVVGVSDALLDRHEGFFPRARQHLIRHPRPSQNAPPPPASPPQTIGYLGALEAVKGLHVLLEAAPQLIELGFALRVAGDGSLRPAVEQAAGRLHGVNYVGRVTAEARDSFIASCDVGLVPSIWAEPGGPPLVLLEWLASGRPVVSSGRGGLAELEGAGGVVEAPPTADGLVQALAGLRENATWDGLRATVQAPTLPSLDEWLDLYERVLRGNGR